jgi:DNA-binding XRE family transcriptional regulator
MARIASGAAADYPKPPMKKKKGHWPDIMREARLEHGWTKAELAKRSGIHRTTIHRVEQGKSKCGIRVFEVLLYTMGYVLMAIPKADPCAVVDPDPQSGM